MVQSNGTNNIWSGLVYNTIKFQRWAGAYIGAHNCCYGAVSNGLSPSCDFGLMPKMVPLSTLQTVVSYARTNALPNIRYGAKMAKVGRI